MGWAAGLSLACLAVLAARTSAQPPAVIVSPADYPPDVSPGVHDLETIVRYRLDRSGRVTDCAAAHPSGRPSIDAESCHILLTRARIRPQPGLMHGQLVMRWLGEAAIDLHQARGEPLPFDLSRVISGADYPHQAIAHHEQGTVEFAVAVSPEGAPLSCTITRSSGSEVLDRRACDVVTARGAFIPATDGSNPVSGVAHGRIRWTLPH